MKEFIGQAERVRRRALLVGINHTSYSVFLSQQIRLNDINEFFQIFDIVKLNSLYRISFSKSYTIFYIQIF
jgi:hypothetical protein